MSTMALLSSKKAYAILTTTLGITRGPASTAAFQHLPVARHLSTMPVLISPTRAKTGSSKRIQGTRNHAPSSVSFSTSSSFQAPEPPASQGTAIFPHVDLSSSSQPTQDAIQRNSDPNAVFVVNGSSRGIGLQVVRSLLERTQGTIVAACRNPKDMDAFIQTLDASMRPRVVPYHLADQSTIDALAEYLQTLSSSPRADGLFNVAGILGDGQTTPGPERALGKIERSWLEQSLQVNLVGHVMLIQALQPLLASTTRRRSKDANARPASVVVNWSARVGSISDNGLGGWYSYRMSKAALNQATRTMAHEFKRQGILAIAVHPGTTDTDLSKPFQKNVAADKLFPVEFSVEQILNVVDRIEPVHSGGLFDWAGKAIPF